MKLAYALAAMLAASPAYAWDAQTAGHGPQAIGQDSGSAAAAQANQRQGQSQTATGGSARATGGNAASRSSATGGKGGSSSVRVTNSLGSSGGGANIGGLGLTVPGGYGNAPCGGGIGLGGLGLSGGGSGGGTLWEFADCKRMRESSALLQLGYPDAALAELCQIDRVREAFGGRCPGEPGAVMVQMPAVIVEAPPVKHWAVVPCHVPGYRDTAGRCHYPAPKPKPVVTLQPMTCHDLIIETLRECRAEHEERR